VRRKRANPFHTAANPGFSSFVGTEVDLDATYSIRPWLILRGGYGHFFAGDYIRSWPLQRGGATDADWLYIRTTFSF